MAVGGGKSEYGPDGSIICIHAPEFYYPKELIVDKEDIYPLQQIQFEGFTTFAPNNVEKYLTILYGPGFMGFPTKGVLKHGTTRPPLSTWAKTNHVDMTEVKQYLARVLNR